MSGSTPGIRSEAVTAEDAAAVADRILERADALAALSSHTDGIERTHLTAEHRAANDLVAGWIREAGLNARVDAAGNVCGRLEGVEPGLPALLLGSHLDTVPDAGRYDGILGVLLAIEAAAFLSPRADELPFAVEVIGFSDEEGARFGNALFGSRAIAGGLDESFWSAEDADGVTLRDAFAAFGLDEARVGDAARAPHELVGYLEAHIEQGPFLEDSDQPLAVVTSIAAARRFALDFHGVAAHAGGTPYDRRRDALLGAAAFALEVERIGRATGVIATVGRFHAHPGGVNVIPGRVELSLDVRAPADVERDHVVDAILERGRQLAAERGLRFESAEIYRADATIMDEDLAAAIAHGIETVTAAHAPHLWSRAGHDGMAVAAVTDVAMLFVRNGNGGISHSPDEIVESADVALAHRAFVAAIERIAAGARSTGVEDDR
ncbi:allantoate amidohydrolase [Agromyces seonyuensis]|uniref:allantoate amidohydrolase n=1 Tax=Agromyces seonyuensis TaxID=2662446 RepID=UPI003014FC11